MMEKPDMVRMSRSWKKAREEWKEQSPTNTDHYEFFKFVESRWGISFNHNNDVFITDYRIVDEGKFVAFLLRYE